MKIATQHDVDTFIDSVLLDEKIYPYLTVQTFFEKWQIPKSDWHGIIMTNDQLSYMAKVSFDRSRNEIEFNICIYAKSTYSAAFALKAIDYLIKRYKPKALNSIVSESNIASIRLNKKIMGEPWGRESLTAWNSLSGKFEDLLYFRKLL